MQAALACKPASRLPSVSEPGAASSDKHVEPGAASTDTNADAVMAGVSVLPSVFRCPVSSSSLAGFNYGLFFECGSERERR